MTPQQQADDRLREWQDRRAVARRMAEARQAESNLREDASRMAFDHALSVLGAAFLCGGIGLGFIFMGVL
jgi:predicted ATPase